MIVLPVTVNRELSPPTETDNAPEPSMAISITNDDGGDALVLTTVSALDDAVVFVASKAITASKSSAKVVASVLVSRTRSLVSENERPRSLIESPPMIEFSACSIWVMMFRIEPSPNSTELGSAVPSEVRVCWVVT